MDRLRPRERQFFSGFMDTEIETLETFFTEYEEESLNRGFCLKVAQNLSRSTGRAGKPVVKWHDVQNWFQNQQQTCPVKPTLPSIQPKEFTPLHDLSKDFAANLDASEQKKANEENKGGEKIADLSELEFEARSSDGACTAKNFDYILLFNLKLYVEQVRVIEVEEVGLIEERKREQSLHAQKLMGLNNELADLSRNLREKEVENEEIRAKIGFLEHKIEEGKRENDAHLETIADLEKKIGVLEMKTSEVLKQTEGWGEEMENKVLGLERTLASWVSNVPMEKVLANAEVEKIVCLAMKVSNSRGIGVRAERVLPTNVIEIESDDDDDELPLREVKKRSLKKRTESEGEGSSEDSLNPKIKLKKLNDLDHETFKHGASVSATVSKCNDKMREGSTGEDNLTSTFSSSRVKDLLATCRRRKTINLD